MCHGFRLTKQDDYFWVNFDHFWSKYYFLRQLGQKWKSAEAYEFQILTKLSLPKSSGKDGDFEWEYFENPNHEDFEKNMSYTVCCWELF